MYNLLILITGIVIGVFLTLVITIDYSPSAMDVYRGRTTLEYTVRDGIVIDSTVVFKVGEYGRSIK